ncbi:Alpha/Beta hydrolase protein [Phyllosticta citriasiana]|uniref:Alpha/Beta hydrolase protein n=1 Tax=Phyllosticta citriasiana TaxID=595635 RepID=A0ABR1KSZ8_9PEZI
MIIIPPTHEHEHTVIFLHNQDTTPAAFSTAFFERSASHGSSLEAVFPSIKWIFPSSALSVSTPPTPSWFTYWNRIEPERLIQAMQQREELTQNLGPLLGLIDAEVEAVGGDHVCLAGMGQGCAMAAVAFLTGWHDIGCFVGLAGWLARQERLETIIADSPNAPEAQRRMPLGRPVLLLHCRDDDVVPAAWSEGLRRVMQDMGMVVQCRVYELGGHEGVTESHAMGEFVRFLEHWVSETT